MARGGREGRGKEGDMGGGGRLLLGLGKNGRTRHWWGQDLK